MKILKATVISLIAALMLLLALASGMKALGQEAPVPNTNEIAATNTVIDGKTGPGSSYRLVKPANWNGGLVLFAHGALARTAPPFNLDLSNTIATWVTAHGYAFAISTFSENGWAVKDGAQRTHQLVGIFAEQFGAPDRVYLMGGSMGDSSRSNWPKNSRISSLECWQTALRVEAHECSRTTSQTCERYSTCIIQTCCQAMPLPCLPRQTS